MSFTSTARLMVMTFSLFQYSNMRAHEQLAIAFLRLKAAYPDHIHMIHENDIVWADGTRMPLGHSDPMKTVNDKLKQPTLADQLEQSVYKAGELSGAPQDDPGRIRYEPFFRKMYGNSREEVESNLETIVWMPRVFGDNARVLPVLTRINDVHKKIQSISCELEELVAEFPEYIPLLERPAGTYCWRFIANTDRLSPHSFGMTLDINAVITEYWQWDLSREGRDIDEDQLLAYRNTVPWEIVEIFEKYGFIWGGKWYHYDTMHFEYRPELMVFEQS